MLKRGEIFSFNFQLKTDLIGRMLMNGIQIGVNYFLFG